MTLRVGVMTFPTAYSMAVGELAAALEARGFESLWLPEHSHIPVRHSPWPGGAELPASYYDVYDPIVALALAAENTTTLRLGTAVLIMPQRDPIQLAKSLATIDVVSGGRLEVGIGGGWNLEEMRNHGTDPSRRFRRMREGAEAMVAIWTQDAAEYHGELVDFDPIQAWPKPVQRPHPRIHVGGAAPSALQRVVRYGDGWIPMTGRGEGELIDHVRELRRLAAAAGRDPDALEVTVCGAPRDPEALDGYVDAGVDRVLFVLPSKSRDEMLSRLDGLAPILEHVAADAESNR
jgi:probable F420-dependent oxidoreductase